MRAFLASPFDMCGPCAVSYGSGYDVVGSIESRGLADGLSGRDLVLGFGVPYFNTFFLKEP